MDLHATLSLETSVGVRIEIEVRRNQVQMNMRHTTMLTSDELEALSSLLTQARALESRFRALLEVR